jgi:hypothetical protein
MQLLHSKTSLNYGLTSVMSGGKGNLEIDVSGGMTVGQAIAAQALYAQTHSVLHSGRVKLTPQGQASSATQYVNKTLSANPKANEVGFVLTSAQSPNQCVVSIVLQHNDLGSAFTPIYTRTYKIG